MTKLEMAIRYLCFAEQPDKDGMAEVYMEICKMIHGDDELIEKYARLYDKLLSLLCN